MNKIRVGDVKNMGRWYKSLSKSLIVASTDSGDESASVGWQSEAMQKMQG